MGPRLTVGNILLDENGCVLMGLRADTTEWEFPGGKVDDESLVEAAIREQKEESGIDLIPPIEVVGFSEVNLPTGRFFLVFLLWRNWKGFPQRLEEDKCLLWRWFPLDEVPFENCTQGTQQILPVLRRKLHVETS